MAKWYLAEEGSDLAVDVRDDFATGRVELKVPTLLMYDAMTALRSDGHRQCRMLAHGRGRPTGFRRG